MLKINNHPLYGKMVTYLPKPVTAARHRVPVELREGIIIGVKTERHLAPSVLIQDLQIRRMNSSMSGNDLMGINVIDNHMENVETPNCAISS